MKLLNLNDLISLYLDSNPTNPGENQKDFLLTGSQEILLLINAVLLAETGREVEKIPGNLSGNVYLALQKPSQGKLLNLAYWISDNYQGTELEKLREYLLIAERKKRGWFSELLTLRNAYVHPKKFAKDEVLEKLAAHLALVPDYSDLGNFVIEDGSVSFQINEYSINLFPFVLSDGEAILPFTEFEYPSLLKFNKEAKDAEQAFKETWEKVKFADKELAEASQDDLLMKIEKCRKGMDYEGKAPDWIADIGQSSYLCRIIDAGIADGILANQDKIKNEARLLDIPLQNSVSPLESLKTKLELLVSPDLNKLSAISTKSNPLVIVLRAEKLDSKDFLQTIYLIADVYETLSKTTMKFMIERSEKDLEHDHMVIRDDLPDSMDKLFYKCGKKSSYDLSEYVWGMKKKKRF